MGSSASEQRAGIIVQARLGSTRLPGKVLAELLPGVTVLGLLLERLARCRQARCLVVATSREPSDDRLADWLRQRGIAFFRGSESDCLERCHQAATLAGMDPVVRITADCPLVVPEVVDAMIAYYQANRDALDYLSNRQYTDFPEGLDVEVFSLALLEEAANCAIAARDREHINYYFLERDRRFRIRYFNHGLGRDLSRFKLSIDTAQDLAHIRGLLTAQGLGRDFSLARLAAALEPDRPPGDLPRPGAAGAVQRPPGDDRPVCGGCQRQGLPYRG